VRGRVDEADFPETPGVYVVYASEERPLYVGVAATQSIRKRWRGQHLKPRAGGSALRRTLGVYLGFVEEKLRTSEGRYYSPDVEEAISRFLERCEVEFHPAPSPAGAKVLEAELITTLRPILNVRRPTSIEARAKQGLASGLRKIKPDVVVDRRGYVTEVADNLLPDITRDDIEAEFTAGAGSELESKMLAPWSSSALAVNSFARWRRCSHPLKLAGLSGFSAPFAFEKQCAHGVRGERPHLDVLLPCSDGSVVGVESKCIEYTRAHRRPIVSDAYLALRRRSDPRASSRWFSGLQHVETFTHLDAYQLVKHYLGLAYSYPDVARTLVYIYWEPQDNNEPLFRDHRAEVDRFAELVGGDEKCRFLALSYADHWRELDGLPDPPVWLHEHLRLLRLRYDVAI
jgi:GIY-YIG catalytic domain-containing protein/restriction endonuclease-like protein